MHAIAQIARRSVCGCWGTFSDGSEMREGLVTGSLVPRSLWPINELLLATARGRAALCLAGWAAARAGAAKGGRVRGEEIPAGCTQCFAGGPRKDAEGPRNAFAEFA